MSAGGSGGASPMLAPKPGGSVAVLDLAASQMATYRSYVALLADPNAKNENKLKAAQEINENFEVRAR